MKLYPFQLEGAKFLAERNKALLADEMGLGKSAQAILACDDIVAKRILVLCPAVARFNWDREFRKFSSMKRTTQVVLPTGRAPSSFYRLIVCSYELAVRWLKKGAFDDQHFDVLILDEAHFLKSPAAERTKAVLGKNGLVRKADRVWALTGTPMPNHPGELWVLLKVYGLTKLTYYQFCMEFCQMPAGWKTGDPLQIVGARRDKAVELSAFLGKITLRRRKHEVLHDLPPITFSDVVVESRRWEKGQPEVPADFNWVKAEKTMEEVVKSEALELLSSPSVSTLRRLNGAAKALPVHDIVKDELHNGLYQKVVIFAIHREVVAKLYLAFKKEGFNPVAITGETPPALRQVNVDKFQNDPSCRVFIGNIKAAGTAITLTASDQVVFVEQEWTPGDNAQAAMRCHRIGQKRAVNVRCFAIANSIDEKISAILRRKTADIAMVVDKTQSSEFSEI